MSNRNSMQRALQLAIAEAGGATALARLLGIKPQAVGQWVIAPPKRARAIADASHNAVTVHQLRPDVFGPSDKAAADLAQDAA